MSKSARTLFYWSFYLLAVGFTVVVFPNTFLALFGFPPTQEVWIRIIGILLLVLAYYSYAAARDELTAYFHWSIHARIAVPLFFLVFVLLQLAPPALLLMGLVDLLGAAWTYFALRSSSTIA